MNTTPQQPRYKTGPVMKASPDAVPLPLEQASVTIPESAPIAQSRAVAPNGWHSMDTAPKTGAYVYLLGDVHDEVNEAVNEWYYYWTRQFRKGCWQPVGWWRRRFGPNVPPSFIPTGWRSVKEGMPPT